MSEQALKSASSGSGSPTASTATGTYQVVPGGKADTRSGKQLPQVTAEKADLVRLAQELNNASKNIGRDLRFQVDMKLGYAVIQVLDSETGEIIRQIPQEKAALMLGGNGSVQMRLFDDLV
ncbi:MAG: flagellar protein FlaG [Woeseiaceae bacterium]